MTEDRDNRDVDALLREYAARKQPEEDEPPLDRLDDYLNGRADKDTTRRIEKWLEEDPEAADFISSYSELERGPDLYRGLNPADLDAFAAKLNLSRSTVNSQRPTVRSVRKNHRQTILVAFLATAASVLAVALLLERFERASQRGPTDLSKPRALDQIVPLRGTSTTSVSETNGSEAPALYAPDSLVTIELQQRPDSDGVVATSVGAYLLDAGHLKRVSVDVDRNERNEWVTFRISAKASALFGRSVGRQTIYLGVFGPNTGGPDTLSGSTLEEARRTPGITLVEQAIDYQGEETKAYLHEYDWLRGPSDRPIFGFWTSRLPVVRIRGALREDAELLLIVGEEKFAVDVVKERNAERVLLRAQHIRATGVSESPSDRQSGAGRLELRATRGELLASWAVEWRAPLPETSKAEKLREEKRYTEALRVLDQARAHATPWDQIWTQTERGRIAFRRSRWSEARAAWSDAADLAQSQEIHSEVSARLRSLAYVAMEEGDFVDAEDLLGRALSIDKRIGNDAGRARGEYTRAALDQRRGAPRSFFSTKRRYQWALASAEDRGDGRDARLFAGLLATLFAEEGFIQDATALLKRYSPPSNNADVEQLRHRMLSNYVELLLLEGGVDAKGDSSWEELSKKMIATLEIAEKVGTKAEVAQVMVELARVTLYAGRADEADGWIRRTESLGPDALQGVKWTLPLTIAEIGLHVGRAAGLSETLTRFREEALRANAGQEMDVSIVAMTLLGDISLVLGNRQEALNIYARADEAADELSHRFTMPRARSLYLRRRSDVLERRVDLLLEDHRLDTAFEIVERRRRNALIELLGQIRADQYPNEWAAYDAERRSLSSRFPGGCAAYRDASAKSRCTAQEGRVSRALDTFYEVAGNAGSSPLGLDVEASPMPQRPHEEAVLSIVRLGDQWASFFVRDGAVRARRGDDPIGPWLGEILGLKHLYIVPGDDQRAFDLPGHRLADGTPLGARVAISILPFAGFQSSAPRSRSSLSLIAADPEMNLKYARAEGRILAEHLSEPILLLGGDVTRARILEVLPNASLFHFAGHMEPMEDQGRSGGLRLREGESLTLEDVLRLRRAPRLVVLNGCGTGPQQGETRFGLTEAFLIAGAGSVVATTAAVSDSQARIFIEEFYNKGGEVNAARAFRETIDALSKKGQHDWSGFRLWGGADE